MKKLIFALYVSYFYKAPFSVGKGFLTRIVSKLGLAPYRIEGATLELNPAAWIDRLLVSGRSHDAIVRATISSKLADGGIFVDIGANIGVFTLLAAKLPNVIVYSFEPSPRELSRLYRNLALNNIHNAVVFPVALGRQPSNMTLILGGMGNPGSNSLVAAGNSLDAADTVVCRCEVFDRVFSPAIISQIRVVKVDVEGFEMEVFAGMNNALTAMTKVTFIVEVTRTFLARAESSAEELYRFFAGHGFTPAHGLQNQDQWDEIFSKP